MGCSLLTVASMLLVALALGGAAIRRFWNTITPHQDEVRGVTLTSVGSSVAAGLLANAALVLCGLSLKAVLLATAALAMWSLWRHRAERWRVRAVDHGRATLAAAALASMLLVGFALWGLAEPLMHTDAVNIWFFHARMIWLAGRLTGAGWNHASIAFSNPDYPTLVPALAAQLATAGSRWNLYFPKLALSLALAPAYCWLSGLCVDGVLERRCGGAFLFVSCLFGLPDEWLTNGYMDGVLALYAGLCAWWAGRWLETRRPADAEAAVLAAGLCLSMKNEGALVVASIGLAVAIAAWWLGPMSIPSTATTVSWDGQAFHRWRPLSVVVLAVTPLVLWSGRKRIHGVGSALVARGGWSLPQFTAQWLDHSQRSTLLAAFAIDDSIWVLVALVIVSLVILRAWRRSASVVVLVSALAAMMYAVGMFVVFLGLTYDIRFYLSTAAERVLTVPRILLLVSLAGILDASAVADAQALSSARRNHKVAPHSSASSS